MFIKVFLSLGFVISSEEVEITTFDCRLGLSWVVWNEHGGWSNLADGHTILRSLEVLLPDSVVESRFSYLLIVCLFILI